MAYTIVQAGTSLQLIDNSGTVATLTLPTNVTLSALRKPRFTVFGRYVVMVNSPTRPITIDPFGVVRVLTPRPPTPTPTLSAQSGGSLTGTYQVKQTFRIKDSLGNLISESGFGPLSAAQAVSSQYLRAANLGLSPDDVSSTMLYRNTTGGAVFYPWIELDGNTQTQIQDDLADAGLSVLAAPSLGSAPDLRLVCEWRNRLWGVDRVNIDNLWRTEAATMYAWTHSDPVPKVGSDSQGVTALVNRKESLLVGRKNIIHHMTGESTSNFRLVKVTENCGIESQESVAVWNDVVYWLWKDGVYEMSAGGVVKNISDGKVRSWFTTDSYFNRAEFDQAFGQILDGRKVYRLFLCSAGSTTIDRFVDYDIIDRTWWGPHTISGLTPASAFVRPTNDDVLVPSVGMSSGRLYHEQATRTDDTATAISMNIVTKQHDGGTPNIDKAFTRTRLHLVPQTGGRATVTPAVGELNAPAATSVLQADLTQDSQELGRLGVGRVAELTIAEATAGQDAPLTGYEIEFHELGRR
jgi:hypothetical protein